MDTKFCRLCAEEYHESMLLNIFDENHLYRNIRAKIFSVMQINVKLEDSMAKSVCLMCLANLDKTYKFIDGCLAAQLRLKNRILDEIRSVQPKHDNEKKRICDQMDLIENALKEHCKEKTFNTASISAINVDYDNSVIRNYEDVSYQNENLYNAHSQKYDLKNSSQNSSATLRQPQQRQCILTDCPESHIVREDDSNNDDCVIVYEKLVNKTVPTQSPASCTTNVTFVHIVTTASTNIADSVKQTDMYTGTCALPRITNVRSIDQTSSETAKNNTIIDESITDLIIDLSDYEDSDGNCNITLNSESTISDNHGSQYDNIHRNDNDEKTTKICRNINTKKKECPILNKQLTNANDKVNNENVFTLNINKTKCKERKHDAICGNENRNIGNIVKCLDGDVKCNEVLKSEEKKSDSIVFERAFNATDSLVSNNNNNNAKIVFVVGENNNINNTTEAISGVISNNNEVEIKSNMNNIANNNNNNDNTVDRKSVVVSCDNNEIGDNKLEIRTASINEFEINNSAAITSDNSKNINYSIVSERKVACCETANDGSIGQYVNNQRDDQIDTGCLSNFKIRLDNRACIELCRRYDIDLNDNRFEEIKIEDAHCNDVKLIESSSGSNRSAVYNLRRRLKATFTDTVNTTNRTIAPTNIRAGDVVTEDELKDNEFLQSLCCNDDDSRSGDPDFVISTDDDEEEKEVEKPSRTTTNNDVSSEVVVTIDKVARTSHPIRYPKRKHIKLNLLLPEMKIKSINRKCNINDILNAVLPYDFIDNNYEFRYRVNNKYRLSSNELILIVGSKYVLVAFDVDSMLHTLNERKLKTINLTIIHNGPTMIDANEKNRLIINGISVYHYVENDKVDNIARLFQNHVLSRAVTNNNNNESILLIRDFRNDKFDLTSNLKHIMNGKKLIVCQSYDDANLYVSFAKSKLYRTILPTVKPPDNIDHGGRTLKLPKYTEMSETTISINSSILRQRFQKNRVSVDQIATVSGNIVTERFKRKQEKKPGRIWTQERKEEHRLRMKKYWRKKSKTLNRT